MSKERDPKYKQGNEFSEEELNPNRPHDYRNKTGKSPVGNIGDIWKNKTQEEKQKIIEKRTATLKQKNEMKRRAKEILEMTIELSEEEKEGFLKGLQTDGKISVQDAILYAQATKAIKDKDTSSAIFIRDTSGQKPKDEVEHTVNIDKLLKDAGAFDDEEDDVDED